MPKVIVFGSLSIDLTVRVDRTPGPGETLIGSDARKGFGGKGANQAVASRAAGAKTVMVGGVGDDREGRGYRDRLTDLGIDVRGIATYRGVPTGYALITVAADGENSIVVAPGANSRVGALALDELAEIVEPGDVFLTQLELDLNVVARACRIAHEAGARVMVNLAPYAALPNDVLEMADPVIVNEVEAAELEKSGVTPASLLVTRGGEGAEWGSVRVSATPASVVRDTTGAGDVFCGTVAATIAMGLSKRDALRGAADAASECVEHEGAQRG